MSLQKAKPAVISEKVLNHFYTYLTNKIMKLSKKDQEIIDKINSMSREEMARLWRSAPSGHPYFSRSKPYYKYFRKRFFDELGGFSPEISKKIGWEKK